MNSAQKVNEGSDKTLEEFLFILSFFFLERKTKNKSKSALCPIVLLLKSQEHLKLYITHRYSQSIIDRSEINIRIFDFFPNKKKS